MKKYIGIFIFLFCFAFLFGEKPIIKDLQAVAGKGTKINILWANPEQPDEEIKELLIYRDTRPITNYSAIEHLKPIAKVASYVSNYTDTVTDYKDYFYAIIAVTDKPYDLILPSINSLNAGVHLFYKHEADAPELPEEEKIYPEGVLREKPLPYIDYVSGINSRDTLSEETLEAAKKLASKNETKNETLRPYYFEEDLVSPDGGDDYLLFDVLKKYFVKKDYVQTITMLEKLVGTNINAKTRSRAYFYIGESQYFRGDYSSAVKTFIRVEKDFPVLSKKWIDSSLDHIKNY